MLIPLQIYENEYVVKYLHKRGLLKQYKKSKLLILSGLFGKTKFGEKQPKGSNIWYFRINKQFRAIGSFDTKKQLRIFQIDNH